MIEGAIPFKALYYILTENIYIYKIEAKDKKKLHYCYNELPHNRVPILCRFAYLAHEIGA